jgi:hypothetical protein
VRISRGAPIDRYVRWICLYSVLSLFVSHF